MIKTRFQDISKQRSFLMGMGMLWIMVYHFPFSFSLPVLRSVKEIGYGGTDILLLCSGMGCYFSLRKNADALEFLKRRFLRIYPTWLLFMLLWIPYMRLTVRIPVQAMLGNLLCVQQLSNTTYCFNWYISALWLAYLLAPYLVALCNRNDLKRDLLVVALLVLFSVSFWNNRALIIIVARFPVFYIGIMLGKYAWNQKQISVKTYALALGGMLGGILLGFCLKDLQPHLWNCALYWYPFILITPGLCLLLCDCRRLLSVRLLTPALRWIGHLGDISLEFYLIHVWIYRMLERMIQNGRLPDGNVTWLFALLASLILSELFHAVMCRLRRIRSAAA